MTKNPQQYYQEHKAEYRRYRQNQRGRLQEFVNSFKRRCMKCDYSTCRNALEFHHPYDDKDTGVSDLLSRRTSRDRLRAEIAKCVVLCANCHVEEHQRRREVK